MRARLSLSPWARQRLDDGELAEIREQAAALGLSLVSIGHSAGGWTCRLLDGNRVVAEAHQRATAIGAFRQAAGQLVA